MVVVRNMSRRPVKIKELGKTIPVSDNNYILPEYIYEKYKGQLSLINVMLTEKDTANMFRSDTTIEKNDDTDIVDVKTQLDNIVDVGGIEYTIAPLAE
jgi:hypothetical protein